MSMPAQDSGSDASESMDAALDADTRVPDAALDAATEDDAGLPVCDAQACAAQGNACAAGVCDAQTGLCRLVPKPTGTHCDDPSNACLAGSCNAGQCITTPRALGAACGDQDVPCHADDHCDGQGGCTDNGLLDEGDACGDASSGACDAPDSCNAQGECVANPLPVGTSCGQTGRACWNDDACDAQGACVPGTPKDPAAAPLGYIACGAGDMSVCHPQIDLCDDQGQCVSGNAPDGTPCGDGSDSTCNGADSCQAGTCVTNIAAADTPCGDPGNSFCDHPDSCDGLGACVQNREAPGTHCGDQSVECVLPQACDTQGVCSPTGFVEQGTACGDPSNDSCTARDTCDGLGSCNGNHVAQGTSCGTRAGDCFEDDACDGAGSCVAGDPLAPGAACGSGAVTECSAADSCDGSGVCLPNHAEPGSQCGDQGATCLVNDSCDAAGACVDQGVVVDCRVTITGTVASQGDGEPLQDASVEVLNDAMTIPALTDAAGTFSLEVPVGRPLLFRVHDLADHYGLVQSQIVHPEQLVLPEFQLSSDADMAGMLGSVSGLPALDASTGALFARFDGAVFGGESATLSASNAGSVAADGNTPVLSSTVIDPANALLLFVNVSTGTTTLSAVGVDGTNLCAPEDPSLAEYPVFAHTFTYVNVACESAGP